MASAVWAFSRHAIVPRRFPGYSPMAEASRARMDFPSYPVDIVLPSLNRADTAHYKFLNAVAGRSERCHLVDRVAVESLAVPTCMPSLMPESRPVLLRVFKQSARRQGDAVGRRRI